MFPNNIFDYSIIILILRIILPYIEILIDSIGLLLIWLVKNVTRTIIHFLVFIVYVFLFVMVLNKIEYMINSWYHQYYDYQDKINIDFMFDHNKLIHYIEI